MNKVLFLFCSASMLVRCLLALHLELSPDEAYYCSYSDHISWNYTDSPPLFAYLVFLFKLLPFPPDLAVRVPSLIFFSLVLFLIQLNLTRLFNAKIGLYTIITLHLVPTIFSLGYRADPAIVFIFFYLLFWTLKDRIFDPKKPGLSLIAGLCLSLGCLTDTLMLFAFIPFFVTLKTIRFNMAMYPTVLFAMGFVIPLVPLTIWDMSHHWIFSKFQFSVFFNRMDFFSIDMWLNSLGRFASEVDTWLALGLGALFILACLRLVTSLDDRHKYHVGELLIWTAPIPVFFITRGGFENILNPVFFFAIIPLSAIAYWGWMVQFESPNTTTRRLAQSVLFIFLVLFALRFGSGHLSNLPPIHDSIDTTKFSRLFQNNQQKNSKHEMLGWKELENIWRHSRPEDTAFLFSHNWELCAQLDHYFKDNVCCFNSKNSRQYGFWDNSASYVGKNGYFFTTDLESFPIDQLKPFFKKVSLFKTFNVSIKKQSPHQFKIYRCEALQRPFSHHAKKIFQLL